MNFFIVWCDYFTKIMSIIDTGMKSLLILGYFLTNLLIVAKAMILKTFGDTSISYNLSVAP